MRRLSGRRHGVYSLAFSADSRLLAAGGLVLSVWSLGTTVNRPVTQTVGDLPGGVFCGELLFLTSERVAVLGHQRWDCIDAATGQPIPLRSPHAAPNPEGAFDPANGRFKTPRVPNFSLNARTDVVTLHAGADGFGDLVSVNRVFGPLCVYRFAPGGDSYVGGSFPRLGTTDSHRLCLYDSTTDRVVAEFNTAGAGFSGDALHFAPDGERLYSPAYDRIAVYNARAGGPPLATTKLPDRYVRALAAHPGGRLLATVEDDRAVTFRRADSLEVVRRYDFDMPKLTAVAFSPDGLLCAVGNSRGKVLLFDVEE